MIDRLGDLLRMTLNKSGIQEVSLKKSSTCSKCVKLNARASETVSRSK